MKNKLFTMIIAILAISPFFIGCESDDPIIPEITISDGGVDYFSKAMEFPTSGGSKIIKFSSNVDWRISSKQENASWCKLSQTFGSAGQQEIEVVVDRNENYDDRSVAFVLTAENVTKNILVTQKQNNALDITASRFEVDAKGGTIDVEVKSNVDYRVVIPEHYQSWIKQAPENRSLSTKTFSFEIAENEDYEKREGEIHFKYNDIADTVKICQEGGAILLLSESEINVKGEATTINVSLKSNTEYNVSLSVDWISEMTTRAITNSTKSFKIESNNTNVSRSGKITFTTLDGSQTAELTITQAPIIKAKSLDINFINTSGTIGGDLYIGRNYEFTVNATPNDAATDYEWSVENPNVASIYNKGNSAILSTLDYGKTKVSVKDKISGTSASYEISTAVTNFEFAEFSRNSKYGYPVIQIALDDSHQIRYSCSPNYATKIFSNLKAFKFKEYNSSINTYTIVDKSSIVDIDENGLMTAKKIGSTIIESGNSYGVYKSGSNDGIFVEVVKEINPYGSIGGHEYVDLGLPSGKLWSTMNVGAWSDTEFGSYYLWKDIDHVSTSWGNKWSTPTIAEFDELIKYCSHTWTSKNGVDGYLFTGSNGASMFLPAAGFKIYIEGYGYSDVQSGGSKILCWTNQLASYTWEGQNFAFVLEGNSTSLHTNKNYNITTIVVPIRPISR